nr:hypothetical protein [Deinococcus pimensis]
MKDMLRPLVSVVGLLIGVGLYQFALRFPEPWSSVVIGLYFAALGVAAFLYGRSERWIRVLGVVLIVFGLVRVFL